MTIDELAERTGAEPDAVRRYIELGLLADSDDFPPADAERVRLVQSLLRRGIKTDVIARALVEHPDLFDRYLAQLYPDGQYPSITIREAAERTGADVGLAERVWEAAGLGGPSELLTESDVVAAQSLTVAAALGFPESALLQLVRVYADAMNRVGDAEQRLFHFYVHEPLRASGLTSGELADRTTQVGNQLLSLVEPAVLFFHRRGLARAVRDDLVLHVAEDAGLLPPDDETGRLLSAVAFIDLARFTALTEAMGDGAAAEILNRFSDLVRGCVIRCEGRVVKQIGDAFMLVFNDPRSAVECAVDIRARAVAEPQFLGTRQGIHWGPVLYREGDYYGATVNLAARIVAEAAADQVLVSAALRDAVDDVDDVVFRADGFRTVKHVAEPVEVYDARRTGDDDVSVRTIDPVCGMTVDAVHVVARLRLDDREVLFCSQACLQKFVAAPERYG
jgi:adenylate cyclase